MAQQDVATAFVDWVNTFDKLSRPVNTVNDLIDGTVLIDVVCVIDNKWFKNVTDVGRDDNWFNKQKKLQKLYTLLTRYYEEILRLSIQNIEAPNLNAIAKNGDLEETMKLCALVLTLAVRSYDNEIYIGKIQSLSQKSQEGLMVSIERVMGRLGEPTVQPTSSLAPDELKERNALVAEKEALKKTHMNLMDVHSQLSSHCDDLQAEVEELNQKLKDMELTVAQSSQSSKSDFILRNQIDTLRHELSRSENKRHEAELLIESQNSIINDLTRRVETLSVQADEAARLHDQMDEYRHTNEKLRKTENVIEKYKKKLEEGADVRRALKSLEVEHRNLIEKNQALEEEYHKVMGFKQLMENYKRQLDELQSEKTELVNQKTKIEYEQKNLRQRLEAYEMAQSRDMETIHLLEDRLRELEFGDGERLQLEDEEKNDAIEVDQSIDDSELYDALKGTTMTSLKLKVMELQRELDRHREGKPTDGDSDAQLLVLQHMLEDANRAKAKFEKDFTKVQKEKVILESELANLQNGSSSNGVEKQDNRRSREKERELTEAKRRLAEIQAKLERAEKEMGESKSDSILEDKIKELESEKEELKNQNIDLKSFLQNLEGKSEEDLKSQNFKLHREVADKKKKIENLKQFIACQNEIIQNHKSRETAVAAERQVHAEEIARLELMNNEAKENATKEINLVTSAWFSMGRRIQGDHVFLQRQGPTSFLGVQRKILDTQLKR